MQQTATLIALGIVVPASPRGVFTREGNSEWHVLMAVRSTSYAR
jgi:hypothetical protein